MKVYILSKTEFEKSVVPKLKDKWSDKSFFISILDPDNPDENYFKDSENYKTIRVWDLEETVGNYTQIFNERQAKELTVFIEQNKDKESCIVHCSAGVSRSGAIGEFINDLYGESYRVFRKRNFRIIPNQLIKRLLNEQITYI